MTLSADGFLIAVGLFTLIEFFTLPLIQRQALRGGSALMGSSALFAAFVSLVVTTIVSDGLEIEGLTTWLSATVIVWGAALIATLVLPVYVFKSLREDNNNNN